MLTQLVRALKVFDYPRCDKERNAYWAEDLWRGSAQVHFKFEPAPVPIVPKRTSAAVRLSPD